MKTGINTANLTASGTLAAGAVVGAMASRVIASKMGKLLEKSPAVKHGILAAVGVAAACFADDKSTAGKAIQGVGVGAAAAQLNEVLKIVLKKDGKDMEDGIMKTALGAPDEQPIIISPSYDYYPYEDVSNPYEDYSEPVFLSGVDLNGFAQV